MCSHAVELVHDDDYEEELNISCDNVQSDSVGKMVDRILHVRMDTFDHRKEY